MKHIPASVRSFLGRAGTDPRLYRHAAFVLVAHLAIGATSFAQSTFSDSFLSASSFSSNYTSGSQAFTWSSGSGTGGGSGLYFQGQGGAPRATLDSNVATFANTVGETNKVSAFFRASGIPIGASEYVRFEVGFHDPNSTAYGRLELEAGGSGSAMRFKANAGFLSLLGASGITLFNNEWYRLELSLVKSSTANTFTVSAVLENWGLSGSSLVSQVYSGSRTNGTETYSSLIYAADTLVPTVAHTGYMEVGSNTLYVDNLSASSTSAIPEPSTYAALMGFAVLTGVIVWKRTRRGNPHKR